MRERFREGLISGPKPLHGGERSVASQVGMYLFILGPFVALLVAIPLTWGWGVGLVDLALAVAFYTFTCLGVTVGFHRYFTHRSFKANRAVRIGLAIAGSMALQGPILHWVADHRRHHAFSDRDGDPHSPWLFGTSPLALARGFWHAHMGWIFDRKLTNQERFAPDLLADKDIRRVHRQFGLWTAVTVFAPAALGGLLTWSWWGVLTAFFWAGLVRISFLHHVTWSVNSICHMIGSRPFAARDRSANFWPLAILSMGESWHNSHHADPTCARHGVRRGQIDISARLIWLLERLGWVSDVRWPTQRRLAQLSVPTAPGRTNLALEPATRRP